MRQKPQKICRITQLKKNVLGPYANKIGNRTYVKPGNSRTVAKVPPS